MPSHRPSLFTTGPNLASQHSSHSSQDRSTSREHGRSPGRDESRRAARRRSIDIVAEANGDVASFVQELELKRKQLDEQIHKFIAAKEREYKRFEQEIRRQYQTASLHRSSQDDLQTDMAPQISDHQDSMPSFSASSEGPEAERHDDQGNVRTRIDRKSANSGLEDVRPSCEREKDFMGLFTPVYLPLLDGKPDLGRSPSAPNLTDSRGIDDLQTDRQPLQRAHTEPLLDGEGRIRPRQNSRTPSSCSDGLVSALKSSSGRKPKPMRVMLQLADDLPAVHPNDDLPTEREYAPVRQAEAMHHSKSGRPKPEDDSPLQSPALSPITADKDPNEVPTQKVRSSLTQGLAIRPSISLAPPMSRAHSRNTSDDFDDLASPFPLDEEAHETQPLPEPDWEVDFQENIEEAPAERSPISISRSDTEQASSSPLSSGMSRGSLGAPTLKIRSSSSSSTQPISPGFSRPSVQEDPKFEFFMDQTEQVENLDVQGSLYDTFSRPSLTGRGTMTGSLGESYMQRNAEAMMRRKRS